METTLAFIVTSLIAGLIGSVLMDVFLLLASQHSRPKIEMTEALGSLFLGRLEDAKLLGRAIHLISGAGFGLLYGLIMAWTQAATLPYSIFMGLGLGLLHGIFMSYCLMFIVAERHPIEKYRQATIQTGALHLLGHIIYGGVTGLVVGLLVLIK